MRVCFYTLGCKVNQNETGALMQLFYENGFDIVSGSDNDTADVYIVNSCTVTASGDKKSRNWLARAKRKNPGAVTVLTGCYPQAFANECDKLPEADIVTGTANRRSLPVLVNQFLATREPIVAIQAHTRDEKFEVLHSTSFQENNHTRAFIKIEDGCDRRCAYCIIPYARGSVRSRTPESIIGELEILAKNGYKEVVLTGINLTFYGKDLNLDLAHAVEAAASVKGIERIRLGSIEPDMLSDELLERLSKIEKLCPQFHLSLQSGCDSVLKRMNRKYTSSEYRNMVAKLRSLFKNAVFTTDIIVGFPGETDEEFEESLAFAKSLNFLKVHPFSYSRRPGTPANDMPNQIDEQTKSKRSRALITACDEVRKQVINSFLGQEEEVLLEKPISNSTFTGYTKTYIPVIVKTKTGKQGDIVKIKIDTFDGDRCQTDVLEGRND